MGLYIRVYMIVDLKVHVEIVHYKGRQFSNMRPREKFFWIRFFFCESFRTDGTSPGRDNLLEEMVKHLL
jgi:hypothetical protein